MLGQQRSDVKLEFLRDDPISEMKLDEFKHTSIAKTLEGIIKDTSSSLTIGLFANWGVGKSGVSSLLKNFLLQDRELACIEFDVWKYEDEVSLRRQFLYSLDKQLRDQGKSGKNEVSELLATSITKEVDDGLKIDQAAFAKFIVVMAIIVYVGIATSNQLIFGATALAGIVSVVGLSEITKTGLAIVKNKKKSVTESRLTDSDEFEQEFHRIVDESKAKKIVVILDNLDRATEEKAVILLSTVKSFLEYGKCIYLVPCDEGAVKKHLKSTYNYDDDAETTADEFLRKFFNTYIRIPDFIDADLQVYTEKHLRKTKFDEVYPAIENLATVITSAYRNNPRQIKQFINIFLAHYLLAMKREDDGDMPPSDVTGNPEFLAKILIIQQKWPEQFKNILKGQSLKDAAGPEEYKTFLTGSSLTEEPLNTKSFLYYKRSQRASSLPPGISEALQTAAEDAKLEDIRSLIDKVKEDKVDHSVNLNNFIRDILDDAVRGNRRQIIINIIKSLDFIWLEKKFLLDSLLLQRVDKAVKDNLLPEDLFAANEVFVSHALTAETSMVTKNAVAKKYVDSLNPGEIAKLQRPENVMKVLNFVERNEPLFNTNSIKGRLSTNLVTFVHDIKVIKKILSSEVILTLVQPSFINEAVSKMTKADTEIVDEQDDLFKAKSELLTQSPNAEIAQMNEYLQSVGAIIGEVIQLGDASKFLGKIMPTFLDTIKDRKDLIIKNDNSNSIVDMLINACKNNNVFEERTALLKPLLVLRDVADDTQIPEIQGLLNQQIVRTVETAEDFLTDHHFENLFNDVRNPLEDTAINNGPFINVIWKYGDTDAKISLIERLFTVSSNTALSFLEERVSANDLPQETERLGALILEQAKRASVIDRRRYYDLFTNIYPKPSGGLREEIISQVKEMANQADPTHQEQAETLYEMFQQHFTKAQRKEISIAAINWLQTQSRINSNFLPSIKIALSSKHELTIDDTEKLYRAVFELWALQETDENQLQIIRDNVNLDLPKKLRNDYYAKINERIAALPHMSDSLNLLKDKIEADSTSKK